MYQMLLDIRKQLGDLSAMVSELRNQIPAQTVAPSPGVISESGDLEQGQPLSADPGFIGSEQRNLIPTQTVAPSPGVISESGDLEQGQPLHEDMEEAGYFDNSEGYQESLFFPGAVEDIHFQMPRKANVFLKGVYGTSDALAQAVVYNSQEGTIYGNFAFVVFASLNSLFP